MADPATQVEGECIKWGGQLDRQGYGRRSGRLAHRIIYEAVVGPIPDGLTIDHLCRNRACVNTAHLEPVTIQENLARGKGFGAVNRAKTHCPQGHEYTTENTVVYSGARRCRACLRTQRAMAS